MARLDEAIRRERARLVALDETTLEHLNRSYRQVLDRMRTDLEQLTKTIEAARAAGEQINPQWLYGQQRYRALVDQTERRLDQFYKAAGDRIAEAKREALTLGASAAETLTVASMGAQLAAGQEALIRGTFNHVHTAALDVMLDRARDGTPLGDLLAKATGDTLDRVRDTLASGVAQGKNPRWIAAEMAKMSELPLQRARLIARTEVVGSYRDAATEAYTESPVVNKWVWRSARDTTTCPVCWAMDGEEFEDSDTLDSHPSCRCTQLPRTVGWDELGIEGMEDSRPPLGETGPEAFDQLTEAEQRAILGPSKFEAYQRGELKLPDLVAKTSHPDWGAGRRMKSLAELGIGPKLEAVDDLLAKLPRLPNGQIDKSKALKIPTVATPDGPRVRVADLTMEERIAAGNPTGTYITPGKAKKARKAVLQEKGVLAGGKKGKKPLTEGYVKTDNLDKYTLQALGNPKGLVKKVDVEAVKGKAAKLKAAAEKKAAAEAAKKQAATVKAAKRKITEAQRKTERLRKVETRRRAAQARKDQAAVRAEVAEARKAARTAPEKYGQAKYDELPAAKKVAAPGEAGAREIEALDGYASTDYNGINALNRYLESATHFTEWAVKANRAIESIMRRARTVRAGLVYRGQGTESFFRQLGLDPIRTSPDDLVGRVWRSDSYLSTSVRDSQFTRTSWADKPLQMEIEVPAGTHGVTLDGVSVYRDEREFLMDKGYEFAVVSAKRRGSGWYVRLRPVRYKGVPL